MEHVLYMHFVFINFSWRKKEKKNTKYIYLMYIFYEMDQVDSWACLSWLVDLFELGWLMDMFELSIPLWKIGSGLGLTTYTTTVVFLP